MVNYCSVQDIKDALARSKQGGTENDTFYGVLASGASRSLDRETGTWWDDRDVTVKTQAFKDGQRKLFLPAPVISLTSVTEGGSTLTEDTDFFTFGTHLELGSSNFPRLAGSPRPGRGWSTQAKGVVVVGHLGYEAVPPEIRILTARMAAYMSGHAERDVISFDGTAQGLPAVQWPKDIEQAFTSLRPGQLSPQRWTWVEN